MSIMLRRAWFWGPHYEIEKPHLFHFVFLVHHNRIVMWEQAPRGTSPRPTPGVSMRSHRSWALASSCTWSLLQTTGNLASAWCNHTETSQYNISNIQYAAKMLRSRTGEIQETHAAGLEDDQPHPSTSDQQHICTSNFNNIFNPRPHAFPATSTLLPSLSWSQHLLPSSSHRRISIAFSVLCVHPGPASSHISQPLVASFDKTATAPQTEQQWQSCNLDATFTQKQSHRYHFFYERPRAGGSERASFTA